MAYLIVIKPCGSEASLQSDNNILVIGNQAKCLHPYLLSSTYIIFQLPHKQFPMDEIVVNSCDLVRLM